MSRLLIATLIMLTPLHILGHTSQCVLSLEEVLAIAREQNLSISIAHEEISTASATSYELNALWFPTLTISGEYSHSLTEIAAVTTLGEVGGELLGTLSPIISSNPLFEGLLADIEDSHIRIPIVPRNTAEIGAELSWVVFSGGRRIAASRISQSAISIAREQYNATENEVIARVAEAYWGLALAEQLTEVRRTALSLHREHLRQAQRLEEEGMINRAERLIAEVAYKQSATLLASAEGDLRVASKALATLLNTDSLAITTATPLTLPTTIPTKEELSARLTSTPTLLTLKGVEKIAATRLNAERSRYLPTVALLAHQQLWSAGLDKNIFPRTTIGVGLSWTLFDGLAREGAIARSRSTLRSTQISYSKSFGELQTAIDKFHSILTTALTEYWVQQSTITLAEELLRTQQRAFAEGMATSSDVVDATQRLSEVRLSQLATIYTINTSLATLLMLVGESSRLATYFSHSSL